MTKQDTRRHTFTPSRSNHSSACADISSTRLVDVPYCRHQHTQKPAAKTSPKVPSLSLFLDLLYSIIGACASEITNTVVVKVPPSRLLSLMTTTTPLYPPEANDDDDNDTLPTGSNQARHGLGYAVYARQRNPNPNRIYAKGSSSVLHVCFDWRMCLGSFVLICLSPKH